MLFNGSYTALLTPFKDSKVDFDAYRKLIDFQIENGTQGLVPVGTTGESPTLSHEEHKKIIEETYDCFYFVLWSEIKENQCHGTMLITGEKSHSQNRSKITMF